MVQRPKNIIHHDNALVLELVDFVCSYLYPNQERKADKVIRELLKDGTGDYGTDDNGIIYVVRYEVAQYKAYVIDLIIREDWRGDIGLIKYIIGRNWAKYPWVKLISFDRIHKYPYRDKKEYRLISFFKKGEKRGRRNNNTTGNTASTTDSSSIGKRVCGCVADNTKDSATVSATV